MTLSREEGDSGDQLVQGEWREENEEERGKEPDRKQPPSKNGLWIVMETHSQVSRPKCGRLWDCVKRVIRGDWGWVDSLDA